MRTFSVATVVIYKMIGTTYFSPEVLYNSTHIDCNVDAKPRFGKSLGNYVKLVFPIFAILFHGYEFYGYSLSPQ